MPGKKRKACNYQDGVELITVITCDDHIPFYKAQVFTSFYFQIRKKPDRETHRPPCEALEYRRHDFVSRHTAYVHKYIVLKRSHSTLRGISIVMCTKHTHI